MQNFMRFNISVIFSLQGDKGSLQAKFTWFDFWLIFHRRETRHALSLQNVVMCKIHNLESG